MSGEIPLKAFPPAEKMENFLISTKKTFDAATTGNMEMATSSFTPRLPFEFSRHFAVVDPFTRFSKYSHREDP